MLPIGNGSDVCGLADRGTADRKQAAADRKQAAADHGQGRADRSHGRAHYNHEHLYLLGLTDD